MSGRRQQRQQRQLVGDWYPAWSPRFWHGMLTVDWLRLLARNRFRVHPWRWGLAATVTAATLFNTKMRLVQTAVYGHRVARTVVKEDPIFIVGHWRSGTTFLHELMAHDDRFATPTTYQCFAANHFLVTEWILTRVLWSLIPARRPMDNVAASWQAPQEDEFALCSMGLPSPYLRMAFPNHADEYLEYLDMEGLPEEAVSYWKSAVVEFVRLLTFHRGKRLVLKSPTHTGRIHLLAEMFPSAKFIHMVRNPYVIFPSTLRLWRSLDEAQGLQLPLHERLEDYVFRAFDRMYAGYQKSRRVVDENRVCDVRYEDLVCDPVATLAEVYEKLDLGDFTAIRPGVEDALRHQQTYQTNQYELPPAIVDEITQRWGGYARRYGYA
jgi:hypothetical protein